MKIRCLIILFLAIYCINISEVLATHNRAGVITYTHISGFTYEITITTYTKYTGSGDTDRPSLEVSWGDNKTDTLPRINGGGDGVIIAPNIKLNIYIGKHTYAGQGTFVISVEDPNRNEGIININNSVDQPFYVETVLVINQILGSNNSPILLQPPIDVGCTNLSYCYNPNAYDDDGDSLTFSLIPCKGANGNDITGYSYPSASISLSIDPLTGHFCWDSPTLAGEYNIAIFIEEWRKLDNGKVYKVGSLILDAQITIKACNNKPPKIILPNDTCVEAGTKINFIVTATDTIIDNVTLTATGGPLVLTSSPAQFPGPVNGNGSVSATFSWQTTCFHVRKQFYQVVFKAEDNFIPYPAFDMQNWLITVIGPKTDSLKAEAIANSIKLSWNTNECTNVIGYRIYRRNGLAGFIPDSCEIGVPDYTGYYYIGEVSGLTVTNFLDDNNGTGLLRGIEYCYMITAVFADNGNYVEGIASDEVCARLKKDVPIITNVSVGNTSATNGTDTLIFSKPTEIDTVQMPGPYQYYIYQSPDFNGENFALIDSTIDINDTIKTYSSLNTKKNPYSYRIDFYNNTPGNRFLIGSSAFASSVFLEIASKDNILDLTWKEKVPWINNSYIIYRYNESTLTFDSIATTKLQSFSDSNLTNLKEYCYFIQSVGSYSSAGLKSILLNNSQQACAMPIDTVPSCPPILKVISECDSEVNCPKKLFENALSWTNPNDSCSDDVIYYNIYYSKYSTVYKENMSLLSTISPDTTTNYIHKDLASIAGCYAVASVDSFLNESKISNIVCVDNCPVYNLPNVFSPNNDNINDFFEPLIPYCFIESIELKVFNRWGQLVFKTNDISIKWDGNHYKFKNSCSDGVYYYICNINEEHVSGLSTKRVKGFIHLIR